MVEAGHCECAASVCLATDRGSAGAEGAWGKDQMESDLSTLVKIDVQKLGAPWASNDS